jgi:hypothetical protein
MTQTIKLDCSDVMRAIREYVERRGWKVIAFPKTPDGVSLSHTDIKSCMHAKCITKNDPWCITASINVEPENSNGTPYREDKEIAK